MGFLDRLLGRERFDVQYSIADPAFAAWLLQADESQEAVTPYTVMGLSAVLRSVSIIATTIAGLPLKTYERQGEERVRVPSDFDDPYPGPDGMTPFAWVETVLMHLLLWREAYLWHEPRTDGGTIAYRPIIPSAFKPVKRVNGKLVFTYREPGTTEDQEVGTEQVTYIPGPSIDALRGHPLLYGARAIFSAAISGDKTAQRVLRRGIRLGGLITPADPPAGADPAINDFEEEEGTAILENLRANVMGSDNAGDLALINRRLKLQNWTPSNLEAQFDETRMRVLTEIEQLFGVPPHLLADTEKQTSWGTGVAEQNLGLARFTLRGWSDRMEQNFSRRLGRVQFCEFDYKALLQGTPAAEILLVIQQLDAGLVDLDYACRVLNLPAPTAEQRATRAQPTAIPAPINIRLPRGENVA